MAPGMGRLPSSRFAGQGVAVMAIDQITYVIYVRSNASKSSTGNTPFST